MWDAIEPAVSAVMLVGVQLPIAHGRSLLCTVGAVGGEARIELLRPQHLDAADGEGAADERPVGSDEAEDTCDREVCADDAADDVDLLEGRRPRAWCSPLNRRQASRSAVARCRPRS